MVKIFKCFEEALEAALNKMRNYNLNACCAICQSYNGEFGVTDIDGTPSIPEDIYRDGKWIAIRPWDDSATADITLCDSLEEVNDELSNSAADLMDELIEHYTDMWRTV